MRFSYDLIKQLVPGATSQKEVMEALTMHTMPAEDPRGNTFDAELPGNRYADLASHLGVALEYTVISGKALKGLRVDKSFPGKSRGKIEIKVEEKELCPRYGACLLEINGRGKTPAWMAKILEDCGLRLINPIVDILNYVMLEVGQPMHAFDADKLNGSIIVRKAKQGERVKTIDNQDFSLTKGDLVIADQKNIQAIAGIKGGKASGVDDKTKRVLIEAANFDQVSIYATSRRLRLVTDASVRFAHGMSPHLVELGMQRALFLLKDIVGAKPIDLLDVYSKKQGGKIICFSTTKFNSLTGLNLKPAAVLKYLEKLGLKKVTLKSKKGVDDFVILVPPLRLDVNIFEDLAEEVVRLWGINKLEPVAPTISIQPAKEEDITIFKDRVRNILTNLGYSEVYSSSFANGGTESAYEVEKALAADKTHLRQLLENGLEKAIEENRKNYKITKIFELGNVFDRKLGERTNLGVAIKGVKENAFLELRGAVEQMLSGLGFMESTLFPKEQILVIEINGVIVGEVKHLGKDGALAELNASKLMEMEEGEFEYQPLSKYPSIMRDLSLALRNEVRVGDILSAIEDAGAKHSRDVDLIDYYDPRHLTFRIVFQSDDRTLNDAEVNKEFDKIVGFLKKKFSLEVR